MLNDHSIDSFEKMGFIVLKGDENLSISEDYLKGGNEAVKTLLNEYLELAQIKGGLGLRKEGGFRELVQKDVGRYDLNLDHLIPSTNESIQRNLSEAEQNMKNILIYVEQRIRCTLPLILSDQYIINAFGSVISFPGTEAQRWHVDVSHLFQAPVSSALGSLPAHFVTIFCPLYAFSEEIGPTEIALNSSSLTVSLGNRFVEDQYPIDSVVNGILSHPQVHVIKFDANIGDIGKSFSNSNY